MRNKRILILGGTGLARLAADSLVAQGAHVTTSLAGVTRQPHLPEGHLRVGGFGGAEGLAEFLNDAKIELVIDATHPFAAQISANAAAAAGRVPLLRLEPKAWLPQSYDVWVNCASIAEAVQLLPPNAIAAVTVGRKEVGAFFARGDLSGIARMIEPTAALVPKNWRMILQRPPFTVETESALLRGDHIEFLVSKNAGGARVAKLDAAAQLAIPVVMIARPLKPPVPTFHGLEELLGSLN